FYKVAVMIMSEIIKIIETLISFGQKIKANYENNKEAIEELDKLKEILAQLKEVLEKLKDKISNVHIIRITSTLGRAKNTYKKCLEYLNRNEDKNKFKNFMKRSIGMLKSSSILARIQKTIQEIEILIIFTDKLLKLEQYPQTSSTISTITSNTTSTSAPGSDFIAAIIEGLGYVKKLQSDCEKLQEKLDRYTLSDDSSFLDVLERENPDAIALWKQCFRPTEH
ncbi:16584_t:CDS:2, partial [Racocetra persica]